MYKEIVTKAILGKGKKSFKNEYDLTTIYDIDSILGCWVINHHVSGKLIDSKIIINGSFDVNIWYSYEDNSKTAVETSMVEYEEELDSFVKDVSDNVEISITTIKIPTCTNASSDKNIIKYEIEKTLGIELIGDTKIKVEVVNEEDNYDNLDNTISDNEIGRVIDAEINENYLDV